MTEFMSRSMIQDKITEIADGAFNMTIVDERLKTTIENAMQDVIEKLSEQVALKGELEDAWPTAISYLMDVLIASTIMLKIQDRYIEEFDNVDKR